MNAAVQDSCQCGHLRGLHEHYRRGSECATCRCRKYARVINRLPARLV